MSLYNREISVEWISNTATVYYSILDNNGNTVVTRTNTGILKQNTFYYINRQFDTSWGEVVTVIWDDGTIYFRQQISQTATNIQLNTQTLADEVSEQLSLNFTNKQVYFQSLHREGNQFVLYLGSDYTGDNKIKYKIEDYAGSIDSTDILNIRFVEINAYFNPGANIPATFSKNINFSLTDNDITLDIELSLQEMNTLGPVLINNGSIIYKVIVFNQTKNIPVLDTEFTIKKLIIV